MEPIFKDFKVMGDVHVVRFYLDAVLLSVRGNWVQDELCFFPEVSEDDFLTEFFYKIQDMAIAELEKHYSDKK